MLTGEQIVLNLVHEIQKVVDPLFLPYESCSLIDFPNYGNVGDSAIWLGMTKYLRDKYVHNDSHNRLKLMQDPTYHYVYDILPSTYEYRRFLTSSRRPD